MDANITLFPGQLQQIRFVMPTNLVFTAITAWDYGTIVMINHNNALSCFVAGATIGLEETTVIEISNAGLHPFSFSINKTKCI